MQIAVLWKGRDWEIHNKCESDRSLSSLQQ